MQLKQYAVTIKKTIKVIYLISRVVLVDQKGSPVRILVVIFQVGSFSTV